MAVRFYRTPLAYHLAWGLAIVGLVNVVAVAPGVVPYDSLGSVGALLRSVAYSWFPKLLFVFLWLAHVYEAGKARSICRQLNISSSDTLKWTIQTFIVGFPSLDILMKKMKESQKGH